MNENVKILTADNFDAVIGEDKVTLVDFWANWCGPCKMLLPTIDEIANSFAGRANICKVDVDENEDIARKFGIMTIPTMIIFKKGEVLNKLVGLMPKGKIAAAIENEM